MSTVSARFFTSLCLFLLCSSYSITVTAESDESSFFECPVTLPFADKSTWYGRYNYHNEVLGVILYDTGSRTIGQSGAWFDENKYVHAKFPWVKKVAGELTVTAQRLDGPSDRPFYARIYDPKHGVGEYPGGFLFPEPGCWQITGQLGEGELSFVMEIIDPEIKAEPAPKGDEPL